jgi:hypothetical protein
MMLRWHARSLGRLIKRGEAIIDVATAIPNTTGHSNGCAPSVLGSWISAIRSRRALPTPFRALPIDSAPVRWRAPPSTRVGSDARVIVCSR